MRGPCRIEPGFTRSRKAGFLRDGPFRPLAETPRARTGGVFDLYELRGLVGELLYLERVAIPKYGIEAAVACWVGPKGADQDFVSQDKRIEVKTIREGADRVRISSAEQLDVSGHDLKLAMVVLEDVPVGGGATHSMHWSSSGAYGGG